MVVDLSSSLLTLSCVFFPQDEADIFSVLFNIGQRHGKFALCIIEEVSQEVSMIFMCNFCLLDVDESSFSTNCCPDLISWGYIGCHR